MSISDSRRTLFELYDKYVGEAASRREVYGYWTFVLGYVIGISGVLIYLLGPGTRNSPLFFQIREVAIVLSALGLALAILGIVFQVPVSSLGVRAALVGGAASLLGIAYFVVVYPQNWLGPGSPQRTVIATYVVGVGLMAGVAVLVPVLTGERSFLLEGDLDDESHAVMVGEAERGGLFAVYRRGPADWRWRLLDQEVVADGVDDFASRPDVESAVEVVRSKVREAGLLEINTAAFRLYGGDGGWRWVLMAEDGSALATGCEQYPDRDAAESAVNVLKEHGPGAELLAIDGAAVHVERDGTRWRWRLVAEDHATLAVGPDALDSREAADDAADRLRETAGDADILAIEDIGFEVREQDEGWDWRLLDRTGTELAAATGTTPDREAVRNRIDAVRTRGGDAPVTAATDPHFELVAADGGDWAWRFVDGDDVVAVDHGGPRSRDDAESVVAELRAAVPDAGVVEGEGPAVEVYRADDGWRWRLVDGDRTEIQRGSRAFETREAVGEGVAHAVTQAAVAELVEFEESAFQLYEAEGGDWRWRLIEEGGELLADSGEDYDTRQDAAAGMSVLKENAPDAELLEIDSAAIELFREDGEWGWRLVDEAGENVAEGGTRHHSKAAAKDAVGEMRGLFDDPAIREVGDGAFQVYERTADGAAWSWRFLAADGRVLADAPRSHTTRDRVERAVEDLRAAVPGAPSHAVEAFAFELAHGDEGWGWRLLDADRDPVARSRVVYGDRGAAERAVDDVRATLSDAEVFELRDPVFDVRERPDGGYTWELVDAEWDPMARAPDPFEERAAAEDAAQRVAALAPAAGELEYENAAFELVDGDGGVRWRFIDEAERELAESPVRYGDAEAATAAVDRLREVAGDASVLEIETASFELHEAEDASGWRWRLVDRNGDTVARSVRTYPTRSAAREGMETLKERAPEAGTVVAG